MGGSTGTGTATLPEIIFETLKNIDGLENIDPASCCECISFCEDTIKYLAERERVSPSEEDQNYQKLEDQIKNLCASGKQLEDGTLTCGLRNKYLTVEFKGEIMLGEDIERLKKGTKLNLKQLDGLPNGYYFIKKPTHIFPSFPRLEKSDKNKELQKAIIQRNWDKTIIETANFPYLNNGGEMK